MEGITSTGTNKHIYNSRVYYSGFIRFMATIIKSYEPTFWDKLYIPALLRGLLITFKHLFRKKVTIQYPDEKLIPPEGYRGLHRLNKDTKGRIKCVACDMCSAACPADCIDIVPGASPLDLDKERYPVSFEIDLLKCIFCGFCEMACPEEAIELTEIYDFSDYTRDKLIIDKGGLLEVFDKTKENNYYSNSGINSN